MFWACLDRCAGFTVLRTAGSKANLPSFGHVHRGSTGFPKPAHAETRRTRREKRELLFSAISASPREPHPLAYDLLQAVANAGAPSPRAAAGRRSGFKSGNRRGARRTGDALAGNLTTSAAGVVGLDPFVSLPYFAIRGGASGVDHFAAFHDDALAWDMRGDDTLAKLTSVHSVSGGVASRAC